MSTIDIDEMLQSAAANLSGLNEETGLLFETRRAHLRELAQLLIADAPTLDTLLERISVLQFKPQPSGRTIAENQSFVGTGFARLARLERAELCRIIAGSPRFLHRVPDFFEREEPISMDALGSIAYLRNVFTDRAYLAFSPFFSRPRSRYYDSYQALCEAVADGSCEACILPIEHAADGKLIAFYRMIARYDLKIAACCDIAPPEGETSRFALLKKNLSLISLPADRELLFEFSFTRSSPHPIGALLEAARSLGLSVRRIDSIPLAYAENSFAFHLILSAPDQNTLLPLLLYLALELPQYDPIGIYACLPE